MRPNDTPRTVVCRTERLVLDQLDATDAAFMLALLNEPSFLRYIGDRGVRTLTTARDYLVNGPIASYAEHGFGLYRVALESDDVSIGVCGLVKRAGLHDVDIGFAFLAPHVGRGYGYESAVAVLEHAKTDIGLSRLVAITSSDNHASIGLLKKLGFAFERPITLPGDSETIDLMARHL